MSRTSTTFATQSKKRLVVHLDRFAGSGNVTEQQIIDCVEAEVPGASGQRKFRVRRRVNRRTGELTKIKIRFHTSITNTNCERIRQCILVLAGVLEEGCSDIFPIEMVGCSDDFESYAPSGTTVDASKWPMTTSAPLDATTPPTFTSTDDAANSPAGKLLGGGALAGELVLPAASTNLDVCVENTCTAPEDSESIKLNACIALRSNPSSGCSEVQFNKVCRVAMYGSRFFDLNGPKAALNGKLVVHAKDSGGLDKDIVMFDAPYNEKVQIQIEAEVDGPLFEVFAAAVDLDGVCNFKRGCYQTDGIVSGDLQSGTLGTKVKNTRSLPQAGGAGTDCVARGDVNVGTESPQSAPNEHRFDLGEPGQGGSFGTAISLNEKNAAGGAYDPLVDDIQMGHVDCGPPDFWNSSLTNWTIEFWANTAAAQQSNTAAALAIGHIFQANGLAVLLRTTGQVLVFWRPTSGLKIVQTSPTLNPGTWQHIAVQYDGSNVQILVDGTLRAATAVAGELAGPVPSNTWGLGKQFPSNNTTNAPWSGKMQEVRVSDNVRYPGLATVNTDTYTVPTAPWTSDTNTLRIHKLDEAYEGAGVLQANVVDTGPAGAPPPAGDVETVIDELKLIAEG